MKAFSKEQTEAIREIVREELGAGKAESLLKIKQRTKIAHALQSSLATYKDGHRSTYLPQFVPASCVKQYVGDSALPQRKRGVNVR